MILPLYYHFLVVTIQFAKIKNYYLKSLVLTISEVAWFYFKSLYELIEEIAV